MIKKNFCVLVLVLFLTAMLSGCSATKKTEFIKYESQFDKFVATQRLEATESNSSMYQHQNTYDDELTDDTEE